MEKVFFVYVIRSIQLPSKHYVGHSENIERRLIEHNKGKTKSTKAFRPWKLVYFEEFPTREEAAKREKFLKSGAGREYLKMLKI
jgi:putative endonuclease